MVTTELWNWASPKWFLCIQGFKLHYLSPFRYRDCKIILAQTPLILQGDPGEPLWLLPPYTTLPKAKASLLSERAQPLATPIRPEEPEFTGRYLCVSQRQQPSLPFHKTRSRPPPPPRQMQHKMQVSMKDGLIFITSPFFQHQAARFSETPQAMASRFIFPCWGTCCCLLPTVFNTKEQ